MLLRTGMEVDRFVIEATLGEGGMATVYRVRHRELGTVHALKLLHLTHPSLRERLLDEGRVQATLHPNVLAVTDVLDLHGAPALVMEYVHGPSLESLVGAGLRLPLEAVELLVPGILAGVHAAHQTQAVHRDLKPGNILLQLQDGRVVPKVADFGLVKVLGEHARMRTASGATMGTPHYMSPEQIRSSREVDGRTDVFALGAVLYELVTGRRTFPNENPLAVIADIAAGNYAPIREVAPEAPDRIVAAIERALQVDAEARWRNCAALWACWAGPGGPSLADAAAANPTWPGESYALLERITPSQRPVESPWTGESSRPTSTGETFGPPSDLGSDLSAVPGGASRWLVGGIVGGLFAAVGLAAVAVAGLMLVVATMDRESGPTPEVAPALMVPAPRMPQAVAEPAQAPERDPPGQATEEPTLERVEPMERVEPEEPEAPAPRRAAATPALPPAALEPARVHVQGDASVRVLDAGDDVGDPSALPPGSYTLEARFHGEGDWVSIGRVELGAGQVLVVRCVSSMRNCGW